jgi:hypothetical protein
MSVNFRHCACFCHGPWGGVIPPTCNCSCRNQNTFTITNSTQNYALEIKELKEQIKALTDMYKELSIRVVAQHEFKLRQLDENKDIADFEKFTSFRIDRLENNVQKNEKFNELEKRIEKLEYENKMRLNTINLLEQSYDKDWSEFNKRIEKLELKNIAHQIERIAELEKIINDKSKKPNKCPVCYGNGKIQITSPFEAPFAQKSSDAMGRYFIECSSCNGKGILWE